MSGKTFQQKNVREKMKELVSFINVSSLLQAKDNLTFAVEHNSSGALLAPRGSRRSTAARCTSVQSVVKNRHTGNGKVTKLITYRSDKL